MSSLLEEVKQKQFVQRRLETVFQAASFIFSKVENTAPFVKKGLDKLEERARPLIFKITQIGQPMITSLDNSLSAVYTDLETRVSKLELDSQQLLKSPQAVKARVVGSSWFKYVDSVLPKSRPSVDFKRFFSAATASFAQIKEGAAAGDFNKYLADLRSRLSGVWNDKLAAPAREFYNQAEAQLKHAKSVPVSEVVSNIKSNVLAEWRITFVTNGKALYNQALEYYRSMEQPTFPQFVEGLKARLGQQWSDSLMKPLETFYSSCKTLSNESLAKVKTLPLVQRGEEVSLDDFLHATASATCQAAQGVRTIYSSVLNYASHTVDKLLPGEPAAAQAAERPHQPRPSVLELSQRVSSRLGKRVHQHVHQGWYKAKEFSASSLKNVLHVDLIQYAQGLLERAEKSAVAQQTRSLYSRAASTAHTLTSTLPKELAASAKSRTVKAAHAIKSHLQFAAPTFERVWRPIATHSGALLRTVSFNVSSASDAFLDFLIFSSKQVSHRPLLQLPKDVLAFVAQLFHFRGRSPAFQLWGQKWANLFSATQHLLLLSPPAHASIDEIEAEVDKARQIELTESKAAAKPQEADPAQPPQLTERNEAQVEVEPVAKAAPTATPAEAEKRTSSPRPNGVSVSNGSKAKKGKRVQVNGFNGNGNGVHA